MPQLIDVSHAWKGSVLLANHYFNESTRKALNNGRELCRFLWGK